LSFKIFIETLFKKAATIPVAMDVDKITMDSPALKEFVSREISQKTKGLQAQVPSLQNKLLAKNKKLGANKPSARSSNKKGSQNPVSRSTKKDAAAAAAQSAAAATRGSTDDNKKPGKKKQKPKKNTSKKNRPS
jgi:hypothetical protein